MNDFQCEDQSYSPLFLQNPPKVSLDDFEFLRVLGTGAFGAVYLVRRLSDDSFWAFKSLSKANVIEKKQVDHLKNEVFILNALNHPFIVRSVGIQQDQCYLHMVMEFI